MAAAKGNKYAVGNSGRPSGYTSAIADKICEELASNRSLVKICEPADMPSLNTIYRWLRENKEFRDSYARAREDQADTLFNEILDISDDGRNDWMARHGNDDVGWRENGEQIQRSKLRVDARKWAASKLLPKKYGDRVEHVGDGGGPLVVQIVKLTDQSRGDG